MHHCRYFDKLKRNFLVATVAPLRFNGINHLFNGQGKSKAINIILVDNNIKESRSSLMKFYKEINRQPRSTTNSATRHPVAPTANDYADKLHDYPKRLNSSIRFSTSARQSHNRSGSQQDLHSRSSSKEKTNTNQRAGYPNSLGINTASKSGRSSPPRFLSPSSMSKNAKSRRSSIGIGAFPNPFLLDVIRQII